MTKPVCAQLGYRDFFGNTIACIKYTHAISIKLFLRIRARVTSEWCWKICHSE